MYTNQGRSKRKKSTKEKIWFGIFFVAIIIGVVLWKSDIPGKVFDNLWDSVFSDSKETVKTTSKKSNDFSTFIQKFTSDEKFQLEHIKFPLTSIKSKKEWIFLDSNYIFKGIKQIDDFNFRGQFFQESENEIFYQLSIAIQLNNAESDEVCFLITFSKIKNKWMLTDLVYASEDE